MVTKRKSESKKPRNLLRIVCEGETEQIYLSALIDAHYHDQHIRIKPELPRNTGWKGVFKMVDEILDDTANKGIMTIICLIDNDVVAGNNEAMAYQDSKKKMLKKADGKSITLKIIESNPCFEVWFLLHYVYQDKYHANYDSLYPDLRKFIPDYDKNKEFIRTLYPKIQDKTEGAFENAQKILDKHRVDYEVFSYTEMPLLIRELRQFLKEN